MLTPALLSELEDAWARQGASLLGCLRPGLAPEEIDRLTQPLGLEFPDEARMWWSWHDGVSREVPFAAARELGPDLPFLPLEEAARLYQHAREQAVRVAGEQADHWWRPTWFPITMRLGEIRFDSAGPQSAPTPIYWAYSHDHDAEGLTVPKVESFGTMVKWWTEALESGAWRYEVENHRWDRQPELLPPNRERSGLV
jgi:cell wall assembly regulator SMI1